MPDFDRDGRTAAAQGTSTMTAFFDSRRDAEAAVERLHKAELGAASVQLVLGIGERCSDFEREGIWSAIENFFFPTRIERSMPRASPAADIW